MTEQIEENEVLVSCICATDKELKLPVHCFWQQNMPEESLELLILHPYDEWPELEQFMQEDPRIRSVQVSEEKLAGGASRYNPGVEAAQGKYFAIWDSDDYHAGTRLREQLDEMERKKARGCLLGSLYLYDSTNHRAYRGNRRRWEGTLVLEKEIFPGYPEDVVVGADTKMFNERLGANMYVLLDRPELYIYVRHNNNTTGAAHTDWLIADGQPMADWRADECLERLQEAEVRFS